MIWSGEPLYCFAEPLLKCDPENQTKPKRDDLTTFIQVIDTFTLGNVTKCVVPKRNSRSHQRTRALTLARWRGWKPLSVRHRFNRVFIQASKYPRTEVLNCVLFSICAWMTYFMMRRRFAPDGYGHNEIESLNCFLYSVMAPIVCIPSSSRPLKLQNTQT